VHTSGIQQHLNFKFKRSNLATKRYCCVTVSLQKNNSVPFLLTINDARFSSPKRFFHDLSNKQ